MSAQPNRQLRDGIRTMVPPWLADRGPRFLNVGFKLLWSFGAVADATLEWLVQGAQAHLPGLGTPTALGLEGRARGIIRGQAESDAAYGERLAHWLQGPNGEPGFLKMWGHPYEMLRQIRTYIGEDVKVRTVDVSGNWHTIDVGGARSTVSIPGSWNWKNDPSYMWAQLYVIIYAPSHWVRWPTFGTSLPWGGGVQPDSNYSLGQTTLLDVVNDVRALCAYLKPAHVRIPYIIVAWDPDSFDPDNAATWPDGNWGQYGKGSPLVAARLDTARYWAGEG